MKNKIYDGKFPFGTGLLSHTDLRKVRDGMMGGQFWSVYIECPEDEGVGIDDPTVSSGILKNIVAFLRLIVGIVGG